MEPILTVNNISRQYQVGNNTIYAVRDISLQINAGEFTILRGRSGSGKTTLINLLSTLDTPTQGSILYGEQELTRFSENQKDEFRKKEIGIIFQSVALISKMTAYENVEFGLRIAGIPANQRKELTEKYLRLVGLGKRMKHAPNELSGGEQQRIAIARAVAHHPKIIFADEPTAELDTATALHVVKLFKQLVETENITIVMTTHDPNMMEIADKVYTLQDGSVIDEQ